MRNRVVAYTNGKVFDECEYRTEDEASAAFKKDVRSAKKFAKLLGEGVGDTYERWNGNILIQRVTIKAQ